MAYFISTHWNTFYSGDYRYFFSTLGTGERAIYIGGEYDGNAVVLGSAADEWIVGGAGDDIIVGGTGADTLSGGDGNDRVFGGDDNDTVITSTGTDELNGGDGIDTLEMIAKDGPAQRYAQKLVTRDQAAA